MPTQYKTANLDLSTSKVVRVNLKLRVPCPNCGTEMVYNFKTDPLNYPDQDQVNFLVFECSQCKNIYQVPSKIMNMRVVMAYDPEKIRELPF